MRVLLCGAEFGMTGAGLILLRYGAHLVQAGHEVLVIPRPGEAGPLEARYAAAGITRPSGDALVIRPDTVALCNTVMSAPYVQRFAPLGPAVWWLHEGEIGLDILSRSPDLAAAFGQARVIILPTPVLRDRIYRSYLLRVAEERLTVVPYGVDVPAVPRTRRTEGPVRIIAVGSIYPRKRPLDLLQALPGLDGLPVELHFVGRNHGLEPEFDRLAAAAEGRVHLHGEIDNEAALALVDRADILALPSASECLPIAPIEAGMRGVPSVLSDLAGHEGVWRHGQNCLMHPVGDVALLGHMLRVLASDAALRQRIGTAAKMTARRFRTDLMMARLDLALASAL